MHRPSFLLPVLTALAATLATAQSKPDPNPKLGLQPNGSYALSSIETINQVNGNLMLNIPLGFLGPDPVGATHGLVLAYNSKILEPKSIKNDGVWYWGLQVADQDRGGWRYQMGYDLESSFRDNVDLTSTQSTDCPTDQSVLPLYQYTTKLASSLFSVGWGERGGGEADRS